MPKIGKAARGKHRWIGLELDKSISEIKLVTSKLGSLLNISNIKLYDFTKESNRTSCIIKIKLENYKDARKILENNDENIVSITSSGKIKLVRSRMEEYFQRQIDD